MKQEARIINADGDFLQVQNYVMQLVAEKVITHTAFVLYSFYRSVAGFDEIKMGYRFIEANTGISKGAISKCNRLLAQSGLIKITSEGPTKPFLINIIPGYTLPRRKFIEPDRSYLSCSQHKPVSEENSDSSPDERINIDYKNNTTTEESPEQEKANEEKIEDYNKLIKKIIKAWKQHTGSRFYTKQDFDQIFKIIEPKEALKYVDTMWSLDEIDKWTKESDHTISVFVFLYLKGKLQAYYKNTKASRKMAWDIK